MTSHSLPRVRFISHQCIALIVLLLVTSDSYAQQVGDMVIVVAPTAAELKMESRVVGAVPRGMPVTIADIRSDAFQVAWSDTSGWIMKSDVASGRDAFTLFDRAIARKPAVLDYFGRGSACYAQGKHDQAIADFSEVIHLDPKFVWAYWGRAESFTEKDEYDRAVVDCSKAIRLRPTEAGLYVTRGVAYGRRHDSKKAITDFTKAIQLNPRYAGAYWGRANVHSGQGDWDKAIIDYSEAIRLDPIEPSPYYCRGYTYVQKGMFEQAISDFTAMLRLRPKDVNAYVYRGIAYATQGYYDKAIADFQKALEIKPTSSLAKENLTVAYAQKAKHTTTKTADHGKTSKQNDADKALADLTEAIRLDPKDVGAYLRRSQVYNQLGDKKKAFADLTAADKLASNSLEYCEWLGMLWIEFGEYDTGIKRLQTAIRLNPKDPAATFETWPKAKLSADALRHGERQVQQMLKDRPAMAQYGDKAKSLCEWAAHKFAGEDLRQMIYWSNNAPHPRFDADHRPPSPGQENSGFIRVRAKYEDGPNQGRERSFEELWSSAVFELYNIANVKEFWTLFAEGDPGTLSKQDFVAKAIAIESRAAEKTRAFYIHVFLPWATEHHVASHPKQWYVGCRLEDGNNLVSSFISKDSHYWRYYEHKYDGLRLRSLLQRGRKEQATELAAKLLKEASTDEEKTEIYHHRAYASIMGGDYDAALRDYYELIRLKPKDATLYYGRACAYVRKGQYDEAIADCTQAIQLDPRLAEAYGNRGAAYYHKKDSDKAITDFTAMLQLRPKEVNAYVYRGIAHGAQGNYDKAIADFDKALEIDPTSSLALQNRANTYAWKYSNTPANTAAPGTDAGPIATAVVSPTPTTIPGPSTTNSIGMKLLMVPAGEFMMGGTESAEELVKAFSIYHRKPEFFADEYPRHRVRITRPFQLGQCEVTVGQFRRFVEATGYRTEAERDGTGGWGYDAKTGKCEGRKTKYNWHNTGFEQNDDHPVINVTWNDATTFCQWLSKKEHQTYRLPTEAEWEYAARAGGQTRYANGNNPDALARIGNVSDDHGRTDFPHIQELDIPAGSRPLFTKPVGRLPPNAFGLCDMHGNVWEWCADWYGKDYYARSPVDDPQGPESGTRRVRRGGGWNSFPLWARAAFRNWNTPVSRCANLGFRVVCEVGVATTSQYPPTAPATATQAIRIVFGGDVMLDGGPGHAVIHGKDPFESVASVLRQADFAVCNLECVLARGGHQVLKPYTFRGPKQAVPLLKQHFDAVCLANNHTGDFGPEAFVNQLKLLDDARLPYFGGGRDSREARRPLILERNGLRLALLGRNSFPPQSFAAGEKQPGVAWLNEDELVADVRAALERDHADVVIPFLHWGREMMPEPAEWQRRLARRLIDAGAAAVIGGHPHVTQTTEVYRGRPIVYSLGNFVFDYFPEDPPVWTGWLAELTVRRSGDTDLKTYAFEIDPAGIPHLTPRR